MSIANAMEKKQLPHQPAVQRQADLEAVKGQNPPAFQLKADQPIQAQKDKDDKAKAQPDKLPYTSHVIGDATVTIPQGATGAQNVTVVYGGLTDRGGTYKAIMSSMPQHLLSSNVFIFAEHWVGFKGLKASAEKVFKGAGVSASYKTLCGFSKGGETLVSAMKSESWTSLGMMDPSVSGWRKDYTAPVYQVWDFWESEKTGNDNTHYKTARKTYNDKKMAEWKKQDAARAKSDKENNTTTEPAAKPDYVNDPMVVDPTNDDARFMLHKMIKKGDVSGESYHYPGQGHLNMPAAWFSKFGGNL